MSLYEEFINIAKTLNKELEIIPVLYGSLGLEKATGLDFSPQDIDLLVPLTYLEEKWQSLKYVIEQSGYQLVNLHEHEFRKDRIKIGIAYVEDLKPFADVDHNSLKVVEGHEAVYYSLTVSDFLKVYNKSLLDGYRRTKNNNKDQCKLKILNQIVQN